MITIPPTGISIPDISPATGQIIPSISDMEIYSENGKGYIVHGDQGYIPMNETSVRRYLRSLGFPAKPVLNGAQSPIDQALLKIQLEQNIAYAGPLAGKREGLHQVNGAKVLVTSSPIILEPDPEVPWDFIHELIEGMFKPEGSEQLVFIKGWLKVAYRSLRSGISTPGQALAIAGPKDAGKTLFQAIIRECLGGRSANPYSYMAGRTDFNADLFWAECLMFGDEISSTDIRTRLKFGANIKQFTVNSEQRCHAKGRDALTLNPFWRITMSLNEEPENLMVLPPLDEHIADKIILVRARRPALFDSQKWSTDRSQNWARIVDSLPGFLAHLEALQIPQNLTSSRFGIREYHNPELLLRLGQISPEQRLLELIDEEIFGAYPDSKNVPRTWEGKASRLEFTLTREGVPVAQSCKKLLQWDNACGTYLARLVHKCPGRVSSRVLSGSTIYTIQRPPEDGGGSPKVTVSINTEKNVEKRQNLPPPPTTPGAPSKFAKPCPVAEAPAVKPKDTAVEPNGGSIVEPLLLETSSTQAPQELVEAI